ncbi:MAG: hypothetical protein JWR38_5057 [Mucilaginibacter sp.]|nr:hypothetical protein [Mucilaginibacter sp.]
MKTNLMKHINGTAVLLVCSSVLLITSCKKDIAGNQQGDKSLSANKSKLSVNSTHLDSLVAYKVSNHELTMGFYRTWRDRTVSGNANDPIMTELPDSLDVAVVFPNYTPDSSPYWTQLKNVYIPYLHARGTKVIITGGLTIASGVPHNAAGYATTAKRIMDSVVNKYGLDGYDIDIESNPTGSTLTDMTGVYTALSTYLGPKSGTGKLLTFDTNQTGTNNLFRKVYTMVSYVWLQAYGRGASTLQGTWNTFSAYVQPNQFVPGFSFYEENGYPSNYWDDVIYPENGTGRAYDYTRWEPTTGKKGGVFGYAIDRDAPLTSQHDNTIIHPNFKVTKDLIKIKNP